MLREITKDEYFTIFKTTSNPFLSESFISINASKVSNLLFLIDGGIKTSIGIILGVANNRLVSPFSAPFGGFHYTHEFIYMSKIEAFIHDLGEYFYTSEYDAIKVVLPPSIYGKSFNAKALVAMIRYGFTIDAFELTNFVNLLKLNNNFSTKSSREYYRQALRNNLSFRFVISEKDKRRIVSIVKENREQRNRTLKMAYDDFVEIEKIWHVDYVGIYDDNNQMVAGGIFYQFSKLHVVFAAIWGDTLDGRQLRAMDFMIFEAWMYYKSKGYQFIDLGISTEGSGEPNEGLLRFKETHEADTEVRYVLSNLK